MQNMSSGKGGMRLRRARGRQPASEEDKREQFAIYLRAAFMHFRNRDLTFRRALNRVRREGAFAWFEVADVARKANDRKMADAVQSINPFRRSAERSRELKRIESELAIAENRGRNELARFLCAAFYACIYRTWGFDRHLSSVREDAGAYWRTVADMASVAEARQTRVQ